MTWRATEQPPTADTSHHTVTRITVLEAAVDLPVVVAPLDETYPPCDVAETMSEFRQPGQGGVTFIYAHARKGMFLGLLEASTDPGKPLIGMGVLAYTSDGQAYAYEITEVHRGQPATGFRIPLSLAGEALVLQTSETAHSSGSKLLVVARPMGVTPVDLAFATPSAEPRRCD